MTFRPGSWKDTTSGPPYIEMTKWKKIHDNKIKKKNVFIFLAILQGPHFREHMSDRLMPTSLKWWFHYIFKEIRIAVQQDSCGKAEREWAGSGQSGGNMVGTRRTVFHVSFLHTSISSHVFPHMELVKDWTNTNVLYQPLFAPCLLCHIIWPYTSEKVPREGSHTQVSALDMAKLIMRL